jgi:hypothetical protein
MTQRRAVSVEKPILNLVRVKKIYILFNLYVTLRDSERGGQRQHAQLVLERKERRNTGLKFLTSERLSVGFLRRGATRAILKSEGMQPVVMYELMREVRNGRRSPEMVWRTE